VASLEVLPDPGGACASRPILEMDERRSQQRCRPPSTSSRCARGGDSSSKCCEREAPKETGGGNDHFKIRDLFPGGLLASRSYIRSTTAVGRRAPDPAEAEA